MVNKIENHNNISKWFELTDDISKQLLEVSTIGANNVNILQESWQDYSVRMEDEMSKLFKVDQYQISDLISTWKNLGESMNSEMEKINNLEQKSYSQFYGSWLKNAQTILKDFSELLEIQFNQQTGLIKDYEGLLTGIGLGNINNDGFSAIIRSTIEGYISMQDEYLKLLSRSLQSTNDSPQVVQEMLRVPNLWKQLYSDSIELYFNNLQGFFNMMGLDNKKIAIQK